MKLTKREKAFLVAHECLHRLYQYYMQPHNPLWMWNETKQSHLYEIQRREAVAAQAWGAYND
jgi:hypothetical protein